MEVIEYATGEKAGGIKHGGGYATRPSKYAKHKSKTQKKRKK